MQLVWEEGNWPQRNERKWGSKNRAFLLKVSKGPAAGYLDVGNLEGVAKIG